MSLTSEALARIICEGQEVSAPVLQVLNHKPISGQEMYRLLLSDGKYAFSHVMLATQVKANQSSV